MAGIEPVSRRRALIVAGMHRSGTSALTRVLSLLGADLPSRIVAPAADNEPGFWEPLEIVEIHDRALAAAGSAWDDVSPLDPAWFGTDEALECERQLLAAVQRDYAGSDLFVLKDPRICGLLPIWHRVLDALGAEPLFVITVRNPLEVAASLQARNGFTLHKSQLLWLRHVLEAEHFSREKPRAFVSYERLLSDWPAVIEELSSTLGLGWTAANHARSVEVDRFLSSGLRHHAFSDGDVEANSRLVPSVKRLYGLMIGASAPEPVALLPDNKLVLDGIYRELRHSDRIYGPLLAEVRLAAEERMAEITRDSAAQLAATRARLTESMRSEAIRGEEANRLEAQLADVRAEMAALDQLLQDAREESLKTEGEAQERERRLAQALSDSENAITVSAEEVQSLALRLSAAEDDLLGRQRELAATSAELAQVKAALGRKLGERDAAIALLRERVGEREAALRDGRGRLDELAGQVARLTAELREQSSAAERLAATAERAGTAETELGRELAYRSEALSASEERGAALVGEVARLQTDLLRIRDNFEARARELEQRDRSSRNIERQLRSELADIEEELATRDERLSALSTQLDALHRERSRKLEIRPPARQSATGHAMARLTAAFRRWFTVIRWLGSPQNRPLGRAYLGLRRSPAFDSEFYLATYRDVARSDIDPLLHYIEFGVRDGYDPNPSFNTTSYLSAHPELLETGVNPLHHALSSRAPTSVATLLPGPLHAEPDPVADEDDLAKVVGTETGQAPDDPPAPEAFMPPPQAPERQNEPPPLADQLSPTRGTRPAPPLAAIPRGAIVILAAEEGEPAPSELAGHRVWRFPFDEQFAGEAGVGAQQEIDALRAKGAGYLAFVGRARGALELAPGLRQYLGAKYQRLVDDDQLALYEMTAHRARSSSRRAYRTPGSGGIDVICFPIIDWNYRFQRPQQLMTQFARHGHRVFYIATTFQRTARRPAVSELAENVWGVRLPGQPEVNIYTDPVTEDILDATLSGLAQLREDAHIGSAISVVDLPFWGPSALESRDRWGWKVIYDCMDEHAGFVEPDEEEAEDRRGLIAIQERALLEGSDLVLATSRLLHERIDAVARDPIRVPNAADFAHFARAANGPLPTALPRPVVGYYGAIAGWFDARLIARAAHAHPDWSFVLAGRTTGADLTPIDGLDNVHLVGELPYAAVPGLLHQFDVACIPFHLTDLTLATNPVKFFEYMSAGKPVVSVELPELEPYAGYYYGARSEAEFVAELERALREDTPAQHERRAALGRDNTWEARYATIAPAIKSWYPKAAVIVTSFNNPDLLGQCLDSLRDKTDYPNFEVIVVDNGSDQVLLDEVAARSEHEQNLRLIANGENLGFARANNVAIEAAVDAEYIVLLNDDTVVTPNWLGRMIGHLQDDEIGLVGPVSNWTGNEACIEVSYSPDLAGLDDFAAARAKAHHGEVFDIGVLAMYCVAARKSFIDRLGRLDERFAIGMFEDDDFAMRVRKAGKRVVCAEGVFIHHWGRASFQRMSEEEYEAVFEANKRVYEEIWHRRWVPHRSRAR